MVIDCLEFNRTLRLHDPASDLAFLSLECDRLGACWIGNRLIAHYRRRTGDDLSAPLLSFYKAYHALIRAAIAVWHLDDEGLRHAGRWRRLARRYLQYAREQV
jgi:aminoglycoside phosphotransferase family enzyme